MNAITIRRAADRGLANHGWLDSKHTFSFADYHDPKHMGFRSLRVINDDTVAPGAGFGTHGHRDMEIVSYVLEGALEHKDSMGTGSIIRPGDVQRMSAGSGVRHSEYNASKTEKVHFLQIWIMPSKSGIDPSYEQKTIAPEETKGKLRLVAAPTGVVDKDTAVELHADAKIFSAHLTAGDRVEHTLTAGRGAWIHVASGRAKLGAAVLEAGDGASTEVAGTITLEGIEAAEILLFDLG